MKGSAPADDTMSVPEPRSARLTVAALRSAVPTRMWGGKGCGAPCDFCRVLVTPTDVEYEVEAQLDGVVVMLHFHRRCHDAWKAGQDPSLSESSESASPSAA
jgi:hypothetical protein